MEQPLNQEQMEVVRDLDSNLLVLAPAGTGKTSTIARRIVRIIREERARPEEILCLSFTNRACREMSERVKGELGAGGGRVTVRTIHSFCYYLMREYGGVLGEGTRSAVIFDETDSYEMVRILLEQRGMSGGAFQTAAFLDLAKHYLYGDAARDPREAVAEAFREQGGRIREQICTVDGGRQPWDDLYHYLEREGGALLAEYNRRLAAENACDFTGLLIQAKELSLDPRTAELIRRRYRYIHIDEVQDTSRVEYDLLTGMLGDGILTLCGDDNQTIYTWRGSAPELVLDRFRREFDARVIRFGENYRSARGLVNLSERVLAGMKGEVPPLAEYTQDQVELRDFGTPVKQAEWIYQTAKKLAPDGDYSRIAILCRSNRLCGFLAEQFARIARESGGDGVRSMLIDEMRLMRRKEIKDLLAFVRVALNGRDATSLRRVMREYSRGIGDATLEAVDRGCGGEGGALLSDFIHPATQEHGDLFAPLESALTDGQVVVFDVESTGLNVYSDRIVQIAAARIGGNGEELSRFERFLRPGVPVGDSALVHGFDDNFLEREGGDPGEALRDFLEYSRGGVVVGHNVGYDQAILQWELRRHGLEQPRWAGVYDTLDLARRFVPELGNHKLATLAEHFETRHRPTHNAMDDILATGEILAELYRRFLAGNGPPRRAFYEKLLPRFENAAGSFARLREAAREMDCGEFVEYVADRCGVRKKYRSDPPRLQNIDAFVRFAGEEPFRGPNREENLWRLVEFAALSTSELDRLNRDAKKMAVITIHQAKGCEFDYVFLPSLTEYTFPGYVSIQRDSLAEEERLFYVAVTRAKKKLFLSWCRQNGVTGRVLERSRFLDWI